MASAKPLMLEGVVEALHNDDSQEYRRDLQRLEDENRALRRDLEDATAEKERLSRTVKNLQTTLNPMHRALRALFGEIELAVGEEPGSTNVSSGGQHVANDARWENFKRQFPGVGADIIDALLVHQKMSITNLAGLLKRHYNTIRDAGQKLRIAGAITSDGGLWCLKR